jgi:hypothetical protein
MITTFWLRMILRLLLLLYSRAQISIYACFNACTAMIVVYE